MLGNSNSILLVLVIASKILHGGEDATPIAHNISSVLRDISYINSKAAIRIVLYNTDFALSRHIVSWSTSEKEKDKSLILSPGKIEWVKNGKSIREEELFVPVQTVIAPGETCEMVFLSTVPIADGEYSLKLNLPRNNASWNVKLTAGFELVALVSIETSKDGKRILHRK